MDAWLRRVARLPVAALVLVAAAVACRREARPRPATTASVDAGTARFRSVTTSADPAGAAAALARLDEACTGTGDARQCPRWRLAITQLELRRPSSGSAPLAIVTAAVPVGDEGARALALEVCMRAAAAVQPAPARVTVLDPLGRGLANNWFGACSSGLSR